VNSSKLQTGLAYEYDKRCECQPLKKETESLWSEGPMGLGAKKWIDQDLGTTLKLSKD